MLRQPLSSTLFPYTTLFRSLIFTYISYITYFIMKQFTGLSFILGMFMFTSCIKHEVIPPPTPEVDLPASFTASLQGSSYEIIKDVNGYYCDATQAKEILPTPQPSKIIYFSSIDRKSVV